MRESIRCPLVPGLLLVALAAPPALADTLSVPAQFASIGDAVAAAQPGDTISIAAGEYRENLTIAVADLTLKGSGLCILDARAGGTANGAGVIITASGVTLSNLTLRHASTDDANDGDGIRSTADGTTLDKVRVVHASGRGFLATGNGMRVLNSLFRGSEGTAIVIDGADARVEKTTVHGTGDGGIAVAGSGAVLRKCSVADVTGGVGIDVAGDDARVEGCTVTNAGEEGLVVSGLRPVVVKNSVSGMRDEECIVVQDATTGGSVEGNRCFDSAYDAISLSNCQMVTVSGNRVERIGLIFSAGIFVGGGDNEVSGNSIKDCNGWGLYIAGDTNTIEGNKVSGCGLDGLKINGGGGNLVLANRLTGNMGEGLDNAGTGTVCNSNTVQKNRIDIASSGTFAEFTGNKFTTGGELEPPQID